MDIEKQEENPSIRKPQTHLPTTMVERRAYTPEMPVKCAFCTKAADSGEHLWDAWICKLPPLQGKSYFREQILPNPQVREWPAVRLDRKKKTVCEKCNNEWMSDIVNDHAKPCIERMILSDERVELTPKCVLSIVIFAFLKAVIGDHLSQGRQRFFPMVARSRFRRTLSFPPNVQVWLGCIGALDPHHAIFRMKYGYTSPNDKPSAEVYTFTWGVGRLAIQLASIKFNNTRLRGTRIVPILPPNQPFFDRFAIPIWPSDGSTVVWPPQQHLSNSLLDKFSDRFAR